MKTELLMLWRQYLVWVSETISLEKHMIYPSFEGFMGWIEQTEEEQ